MEAIPAEFKCPITHEIMIDPVNLPCGHTFDKEAITEWITIYNTCPFACSRTVGLDTLHAASDLRDEIEQYVGNRPTLARKRQQCFHDYTMLLALWRDYNEELRETRSRIASLDVT